MHFTPDGTRALVRNRTQRSVHIMSVEGEQVRLTVPAITVYGSAYHCEVTPDGELGWWRVADRAIRQGPLPLSI